jgi:hypothetical protein
MRLRTLGMASYVDTVAAPDGSWATVRRLDRADFEGLDWILGSWVRLSPGDWRMLLRP